jgi:hypothetical protein
MTKSNRLWMSWEALSRLIQRDSSRLNLSASKSTSDVALSYISVNIRMAIGGHKQTSVEDTLELSPRTFTVPVFESLLCHVLETIAVSNVQFV